MPGTSYQFDDVTVDAGAHQVRKAGREALIEPKSFRVLLFLIENRGRAVSKEELIQAVWGEMFVTDNALTRVIAQIRKALGDDARLARYIETVPTVGYRFIAEVHSGETSLQPRNISSPKSRWWFALAGGVASFAAAFWLFFAPEGEARSRDLRPVHVTTSSGLDVHPAFSPDGSSIAYANDRSGRLEIYVRPLAIEGREIQLTSDGGQNVQPAWSPGGRYIAYHSAARGGIHLVPALGGASRKIASFGSQPVWSPDGASIAFRGERLYSQALPDLAPSGPSLIWIVPVAGGEPRAVTQAGDPDGSHTNPAWSPDGRRLLFLNPKSLVLAQLWVIDTAGGARESIDTGNRPLVSAVFAPDGSGVYLAGFSTAGESGIWYQRLHRGTLKPAGAVRTITTSGGGFFRDLNISADGKRLGYVLAHHSSNLHSMAIDPRTHLPAGAPRPLTSDTSFRNSLPVFSPDGARIAYFVRRKGILGDIWVMDRDGGNPAPVTTHPTVDFLPNWSADGRSIVYGSNRDGVHK
ncbi:MAG: winged helix-turn-helix domain-containing protein, partial [Bryobacteraceae bacterium]